MRYTIEVTTTRKFGGEFAHLNGTFTDTWGPYTELEAKRRLKEIKITRPNLKKENTVTVGKGALVRVVKITPV